MGCAALMIRETADTPYAEYANGESRSSHPVDPDVVEELGDRIATLSAHIHAATHRLLVLIAEFDRLRGWKPAGYQNCARWLAARTGIDPGAAREKVRAARALEELPRTSAAMARGELSFSQVRALSRVARRETEAELLDLARGTTTVQLERVLRAWKKGSRGDEAERARELHAARTFSIFPDDDGMYLVTGRLTPEVGALLMRAIEAASDALFRERRPPETREDRDREAARRRADAIGLLAERALAAGFGTPTSHCATGEAPISGTRAERYQVVLHVDAETLSAEGKPGQSELEDGTRVPAETTRRIACDASVVTIAHASSRTRISAEPSGVAGYGACDLAATRGAAQTRISHETYGTICRHAGRPELRDRHGASVLDIGRRTRTIPPALRRALEARDRGCRFPGCNLRFTDAHHVKHWADGGGTSLSNCILLCGFHHGLVHEGGWRVKFWGEGRPVFVDPRGGEHFEGRWTPPEVPEQAVDALVRENELRGARPDAWTAGARWERERAVPAEVYFRALEVL
jgi:hypothetical protein